MMLHIFFGFDFTDWAAIATVIFLFLGAVGWIGNKLENVAKRLNDFNHFIVEIQTLKTDFTNFKTETGNQFRVIQERQNLEDERINLLRKTVDDVVLRQSSL